MGTEKVVLNIATGILIGGAVGAVVGILFAPEKGSVTRKNLMDKGNGYVEDFKGKLDKLVTGVSQKLKSEKNGIANSYANSDTSPVS